MQSLYFVLNGLAATRPQRRLPVIYVHCGVDGAARPSQSAAAGFIRPLALVEPQLTLKTVEVDPPRLAEPALTALVLAELAAGPGEVRYAAGGRSSRDSRPVWTVGAALEASPAAWSRERGVYVITGGLGGLGRLFACRVFAGCVTGRREWPTLALEGFNGRRLQDALAHVELTLTGDHDDALRPTLHMRRGREGVHRAFAGFNRAQAAVIEGAVLVSRLGMLPREKVETEMDYLQIAIDKTAGPLEQEAWDWLYAAVQDFFASKPEAR